MLQRCVLSICSISILAGISFGQTPPGRASNGPTTAPASQSAFSGIPKGALGPEYVDGSFGFGVRPMAGATINRQKRTVEGRTQLAQFVRLEIGWSMALRLWVADRPVDVQAARQDTGAKLVLQYPDLNITQADAVQIDSRPSVRLAATFSNEGQNWLRQQAFIPLRGKHYILVVLTTPADDSGVATEAFSQILGSFQAVRTEKQQEQLDAALVRGTTLLKTLADDGKGVSAKANPITYLRTTRDGDPIGFIEIEERSASIERKTGLRIAQRAWLFSPDGGTQYMQEDKFVADDLTYDEWRNFSQILPSKGADPKPRLVVSVEGGIRRNDQLVVEFSNQVGVTEKQDKAIQVERSYAPAAWPLVLPRMVDLNKPELYAFSMYDTERRGLVMRVFRVLGPTQITITGSRVSAFRIEDSEGLVPPISEIDVDKDGRVLRLVSGSVEMSVATKGQIEQEFAPRVKATLDRLRELAGAPRASATPSVAPPSGNSQSARKAPAERSRSKSSPYKKPSRKQQQ